MDKLKLYELLGANFFSKYVFILERAKYKVIDTCFPNINTWYEKRLDKQYKKQAKKLKTLEERKSLHDYYKTLKLEFRKELIHKKNRNYHFDENHSIDKFINYLKWNKKIHKKELIKDISCILVAALGLLFTSGTFFAMSLSLLIISSLTMIIDLECINLQNYNLERINRKYDKIKGLETKRNTRNINKYKYAHELVAKELDSSEQIPDMLSIIDNIENPEQLYQLKMFLSGEMNKFSSEIKLEGKVKKNGNT